MSQQREFGRISAKVTAPIHRKPEKAAEITGAATNRFLTEAAVEKAIPAASMPPIRDCLSVLFSIWLTPGFVWKVS